MNYAIDILVIVFVVLLVLHFLRPPWSFRIAVRGRRVDVNGHAVVAKRLVIEDFFRQELPDVQRARVEGYWDNRRRLRLRFRGGLSPAQQQRIRNFLIFTL